MMYRNLKVHLGKVTTTWEVGRRGWPRDAAGQEKWLLVCSGVHYSECVDLWLRQNAGKDSYYRRLCAELSHLRTNSKPSDKGSLYFMFFRILFKIQINQIQANKIPFSPFFSASPICATGKNPKGLEFRRKSQTTTPADSVQWNISD